MTFELTTKNNDEVIDKVDFSNADFQEARGVLRPHGSSAEAHGREARVAGRHDARRRAQAPAR